MNTGQFWKVLEILSIFEGHHFQGRRYGALGIFPDERRQFLGVHLVLNSDVLLDRLKRRATSDYTISEALGRVSDIFDNHLRNIYSISNQT